MPGGGYAEVFHPSGIDGHWRLVRCRAPGRGAGANCVLSRNVFAIDGPVALVNGSCTNGEDGAFSGAALASQALSELSQTTTQATTKEIGKSIAERRDQERERCPAGFSRVDGVCRRRPVAEPARAVPPEKPKAAEVERRERSDRLRPFSDRTCRPIWDLDPGLWRLSEEGRCWACHPKLLHSAGRPGAQPPLALNIQSRTSTVGFVGGADLTSRGLFFANDGLIAGVTAGYTSSLLKLNTSAASIVQPLGGTGVNNTRVPLFRGRRRVSTRLISMQDFRPMSLSSSIFSPSMRRSMTCSPPRHVHNGSTILPFAGSGSVDLLQQ